MQQNTSCSPVIDGTGNNLELLETGLNLQGADIILYVSLSFLSCNENIADFFK